jgi:subtilisin family serine protease
MENKIIIGFENPYTNFDQLYSNYADIVKDIPPIHLQGNYYLFKVEPETNISYLLTELNEDASVILAQNAFQSENGGIVAFTDRIILKKSSALLPSIYDSLLNFYNLSEVDSSLIRGSIRCVKISDDAISTVLETANRLYEEDGIDFSHPRFFYNNYRLLEQPSDSLFKFQWYYHNRYYYDDLGLVKGKDIDALTAWEITKGSEEIVIAVLDDGFSNHPDIPLGAILDTIDIVGANRDFVVMDSNCVQPTHDSLGHGFACSGEIIAEHNDIGIAGLAPDCKFIFIKIVDDKNDFAWQMELGDAIVLAARLGADVISCSWGDPYGIPSDPIISALETATDPQIEGHSCAVFFAAGNQGWGALSFPANQPTTLSVGATDSIDTRWFYSQYSLSDSTLDVMGPSANIRHNVTNNPHGTKMAGSIVTLDRPGDWGYNTHYYEYPFTPYSYVPDGTGHLFGDSIGYEYFGAFGGTSAACPQVAGMASLILSRRPDLIDSNYTIYEIIKHSAEDMVGPDTGYIQDTPGWDMFYGWGRVNAYRALLAVSRGDADNDGTVNIQDITYLIDYKYKGGPAPVPTLGMGDANCDGTVHIKDITYLIQYKYHGGPEPPICFEYEY